MVRIFTFLLCLLSAVVVKGQQEVWWGYYPLGTTQAYATGDEVAQTYHVAVHLPAGYVVPEGGQLSGVRFKLSTMRVSDMTVWMSSALPEGNVADVHLADVQASDYDEHVRMFVVRFNEPVNVPTDGCYVGVTFTVPEISADPNQAIYDENPICFVPEEVAQRDAFFIRSDKFPYWENYGITGKSLLMQVLLSGKLYENAVRPLDFGTCQAVHGETVNVPVTMRSFGTADVSSIDYVVDTRNRKGQEQHYDLPEPLKGLGEKAVVELPFTTDSYTGNVKKTLRITKVNGQPNVDDAKATGALFELTRRVQPRLLFEEFTGT